MTTVQQRTGESVDHLLRRFRRQVDDEGILRSWLDHERFASKRDRRRRKAKRAAKQRDHEAKGQR